jgi:hypothetical protein
MELIKRFLQTKQAKRAGWTMLNTLLTIGVGFIAFAATENIAWAVAISPFVQAASQWLSKEIINPKIR